MAPVPWPAAASLLAAAGTVFLIAHLRRYRGKPGADWFLASLTSQTVMSVAYGAGLLVFDPALRWALEVVVWTALTGTGVYFLLFATAYTGRDRLLERSRTVVATLPAVVFVVVVTNPLHHVAWTGFAVDPVSGMATVSYAVQPWTAALTTAGALTISLGSVMLFDTVVSYGPLYRREAVAVGLSTVPPLSALLAWLYGIGPTPPQLNLVTAMFLPHVALDAYAFLGSDMFEFHPATRRAGERAAIDDLGAPVVIVDERQRVVTCNDAAETDFGVAKTDALTRPLAAILAESGAEESVADPTADGGERVADGGVDLTDGDATVTLQREGGRTVYAVTATPLSAGGAHVGHTLVFQDVTAERRREQRLDVLNRVLRHNLRNDMTVVQGFTEAAAEQVEDAATAELLERATAKADELVALGEKARDVERVLDRDGDPQEVALDETLSRVVADHADANPDATVTVDGGDCVARTDPEVLGVVVGALVENAFVHGGPAPAVDVTAERRDGSVAITVSDDGPGVPDHELSVLDAGAESALEHGSGLGLWLANWGATTLGGELTLAGEDGTTATVTLPSGREKTGEN